MKVRVDYTVEVPDEIRREIRRQRGEDGLATREEVQRWYQTHGESMDQDLWMMAEGHTADESPLAEVEA